MRNASLSLVSWKQPAMELVVSNRYLIVIPKRDLALYMMTSQGVVERK